MIQMFSRRICKNPIFSLRTIVSSPHPDIHVKKETIGEAILKRIEKISDRVAFINDTKKLSYTYGDVERSIKSIASSLTKRGFQQGSMVSIIATNCPEFILLQITLSSIGCSVMLCNQNYTEREIALQLMDARSTVIFTTEDAVEKVSNAASKISEIKDIYLIGNPKPGYKAVDDLMNDSGNMNPIGCLKLDFDNDVALTVYSSGTTGLPKGIMLTHANIVSVFHQINNISRIDNNVLLLSLPLYHLVALHFVSFVSLYSGSTLVFQPKFESIPFLRAIEQYKVSHLTLVPPQILFLLNHPQVSKYDLSSVSKCVFGAAPLDALSEARFIGKFKAFNQDFSTHQGYGLSETSGLSNFIPIPEKVPGKLGSVGPLLPNMQCKVVDVLTREEVSVNTQGELLLKGPNIMKGYLGKPKETREVFEDGWFCSGDLGHYDFDNYFYISDRLKELIKVNALQVAPAELEGTLLALPGIIDCAVVGVPDEKHGEVPKAFVVKNKDISEREIHDHMASLLSSHKQLKGGITFVDSIPKSPSGKILRRLIKQN